MLRKLMNLRTIFTMLLLAIVWSVSAQNVTIKGTVTDENGEPIIGASVLEKGTNAGVSTDIDGNFSLKVTGKNPLVVSYIGMDAQEVNITGKTQVNVVLKENSKVLDEVVVIGYETVRKKDLTGSVSSINAKAIESVPVVNVAEAMSGKLAGVNVTTSEGSPDAEINIRVRGGGSITQESTPLYIVDGFPVSSISDISPADIQSIDVLKDASSTAIYGSRGANGVVIITTKTAKEGKFSVSYDGTYGFKMIANTLDVMSPYEFAKSQYEQAILQNKLDRYQSSFGLFQDIDLYQEMTGINWQDEVYGNTGSYFSHNVSLSGGTEKVNYLASYQHTDENAIMLDSDYKRDNFSFKLNAKPFKWLKVNFSTRYSNMLVTGAGANDSKSGGGETSTSDSRLKHTVIFPPISVTSLYEDDSTDEDVVGSLVKPTTAIKDNYKNRRRQLYSINGGVSINFIKNLQFRTDFGIEGRVDEDKIYKGSSTYDARNSSLAPGMPIATITDKDSQRLRNTNTLSYKWTSKNKAHNLNAMIGEEMTITTANTKVNRVEGVPTMFSPEECFGYLTEGMPASIANNYAYDDRLLSFFGRVGYDYLGRYLITATFRADGSSKFAPGNQWGYFPSVAAAWRISDESWMESASEWLNNLKLRASYGVAGNNNIAAGQYMKIYSSNTELWMNGFNSYWTPGNSLNNTDIKWETTYTYNIGIDFGFWNNRINGTIDLYQNDVKDLLIDFPIQGTGYQTVTRNIGATRNRGIELAVNAALVNTKDFTLDFNFNIAYNQNQVMDLGGLDFISGNSGWAGSEIQEDYRVIVGQAMGQMWGYVTEGYYSADDFIWDGNKWVAKDGVVDNSAMTGDSWGPGALKIKDLDNSGTIDDKDKTVIGNSMPDFTGGFGLTATYKGFDLSAGFTFSIGNEVYNANKLEFTTTSKYYHRNQLAMMGTENRYTQIDWATGERITDPEVLNEINKNANIWSPVMPKYVFHSWGVEDGSFLRLNTLTLGYTLPTDLTKKIYVQRLRVFFTGTNLFCATKYTGYDPEVSTRRKVPYTSGVDYSAYPKSRGFNFGVNITF
ncbi:MAG: TonB-dependent receptor [Bacteroidaceae bacterium]|nr:TonB-dependent receptor [Bacteroidaceae bacterium]